MTCESRLLGLLLVCLLADKSDTILNHSSWRPYATRPFGQLLRYITRNRVLLYPEERSGFQCPTSYYNDGGPNTQPARSNGNSPYNKGGETSEPESGADPLPADLEKIPTAHPNEDPEKAESRRSSKSSQPGQGRPDFHRVISDGSHAHRTNSMPWTIERHQQEQDLGQQLSKTKSMAVVPTKTSDGTILADW